MNYKSVADLNKDILHWIPHLPDDIDVIVGIPRSGMLAANLLALYLDLPFADINSFLNGKMIGTGRRYEGSDADMLLQNKLTVLVIDDSVCSGYEIDRNREKILSAKLPHKFYFGTVYVRPKMKKKVDFYANIVPTPRIFEWNMMNHGMLTKSCVDIDGVLCRDPADHENDDGPNYINFIQNVHLKTMCRRTIGWLVTCRLEKYREMTETWLDKHNIRYNKLIMMDFPDKYSRLKSGSHASFKAQIYTKTDGVLFIESSLSQAKEIARISGKSVFCFEIREMVSPAYLKNIAVQGPRKIKYLIRKVLNRGNRILRARKV